MWASPSSGSIQDRVVGFCEHRMNFGFHIALNLLTDRLNISSSHGKELVNCIKNRAYSVLSESKELIRMKVWKGLDRKLSWITELYHHGTQTELFTKYCVFTQRPMILIRKALL